MSTFDNSECILDIVSLFSRLLAVLNKDFTLVGDGDSEGPCFGLGLVSKRALFKISIPFVFALPSSLGVFTFSFSKSCNSEPASLLFNDSN